MTIEDHINDEKLQYDINREAAKISALSSGKLDKYEYLTGEEILPSNQQQIIHQAKFNYSPLGKVIEKQRRTIEDHGKKQVEAIQDNKQLVSINKGDYKDKLLLSKEREIFKDISNKRLNKIEEMNNKIDYDDLDYVILSKDMEYNFSIEKDLISLLKAIKDGEMSLKEVRQRNYLQYLNIIRKGNKNSVQKITYQILKIILTQKGEQKNLLKTMVQWFLRRED